MANKFKNNPDGSGKLNKSGFRFNIARKCRWNKETAESLPTFRDNYDKIDFSKKTKEEDK